MIVVKGVEVKNQLKEFTLGEYSAFTSTLNDEKLDRLEKFLSILKILGLRDENLLYEVNMSELSEFIGTLSHKQDVELENKELMPFFSIKNQTYASFTGEKFEFKAKDIALIEKSMQKDDDWMIKSIAILFKDVSLTFKEHYTPAHLRFKESLIRNENVLPFLPYLIEIQKYFTKEFTELDKKVQENGDKELVKEILEEISPENYLKKV